MDFSQYREVIPYARYSSRAQSRGTSEHRQVEAFEAFAAAHGVTLSGRRATDRGLSGYSGANLADGALGALVEALQTGQIETPALLLVERQDRFGRQPSTQALVTLFGDLLGKGCDIYHIHQGRLYSREIIDSDFGALVTLAAEVHAAHHYSATLSQRSRVAKAVARDKIRAGAVACTGWTPRWIDYTPDGWVLNGYAPVVMRLVELIEKGAGTNTVARRLNEEGLPSPRGKKWTPGGVWHVLRSPALAGGRTVQTTTGEVSWGYFPALITRPRREALLAQVSERPAGHCLPARGNRTNYLGQGLTTCADCGAVFGYCGGYIRCRNRLAGTCSAPWVPLEEAHAHLLTRLQPQQLAQLIGVSDGGEATAARLRVEDVRRRLEQARAMGSAAEREIGAALADGDAGAARVLARQVAAAEQQATEAEAELLQLEHELARLAVGPGPEILRQPVAEMLEAFASGSSTPEQRLAVNQGLRRLGVAITIDGLDMGLSIGSGPVEWQPIDPAQLDYLRRGRAGIRSEAIDETALLIADGEELMLQIKPTWEPR